MLRHTPCYQSPSKPRFSLRTEYPLPDFYLPLSPRQSETRHRIRIKVGIAPKSFRNPLVVVKNRRKRLQFRHWGKESGPGAPGAGGREIFWTKPGARFSNGLAALTKSRRR